MADPLDPRLHPHRPDLAAAYLTGRVEAARFVEGQHRQVCRGVLDLRAQPASDAPLVSQLLFGETVAVYEQRDGWAWLQSESDGYVGYAPSDGLREEIAAPSHAVAALRTHLYPAPDLKAPPGDLLHMTSALALSGAESKGFSELATGGWVYGRHITPLDQLQPDYVATVMEFFGTPYLWGGRSSLGLDCSALVQLALARAGVACLRDSDQQAASLGAPHDGPPGRGDLVYFKGHVAIALDNEQVVHANAWFMQVTVEPLADLVARVEAESSQGITAIRRL